MDKFYTADVASIAGAGSHGTASNALSCLAPSKALIRCKATGGAGSNGKVTFDFVATCGKGASFPTVKTFSVELTLAGEASVQADYALDCSVYSQVKCLKITNADAGEVTAVNAYMAYKFP